MAELLFSNLGNVSTVESYNFTRPRMPQRPPPRYYRPSQFAVTLHSINYYSYPIIVVLGSIGNILAYLIFTKTRLKQVSSARFLAAIAVTDTGFLWTFFLTVLQMYYQQNLLTYVGVCQLVMFLNCGFTFLSIWYMVALVVDRFIALYFPLLKPSMCTVFRAKLVIVGMGALAVVCYSYITYFYGVTKYGRTKICGPFNEFEKHYMNLDKLDIIVVAVIPYVVITILVFLILIKRCNNSKKHPVNDLSPLSETRRRSVRHNARSSTRISRVICPVIIITLLFNPPQNIIRAIMRFGNIRDQGMNQWLSFCRVFYLLNFALKGFLYFTFSGGFRKHLKEFISEVRIKLKHSCLREQTADPQMIQITDDRKLKNGKSELLQTAL